MQIRTAVISRNLSVKEGKSNGRPVSQVVQILDGDRVSEFRSKKEMKKLFYFMPVDLTNEQVAALTRAINSPEENEGIITYPNKTVTLDCFSAQEKTRQERTLIRCSVRISIFGLFWIILDYFRLLVLGPPRTKIACSAVSYPSQLQPFATRNSFPPV